MYLIRGTNFVILIKWDQNKGVTTINIFFCLILDRRGWFGGFVQSVGLDSVG